MTAPAGAVGRSSDQVPWARPTGATERATARVRRMVDGLPSWEPLPPGEVLVRRGRER